MPTTESYTWAFLASHWSEVAFHEIAGAGKLARASINNVHSDGIEATGTLEYLLAYPGSPDGEVAFIGYERIVGSLGAHRGSFVVRHHGIYSARTGVHGTLDIVPGSGSGDLAGITGSGTLTASAGEHGGMYRMSLAYPA
ncbi:MAG TPA: DUF3224 domain-containing protein [Gammaproteobacteria bacterium]